MMVSRRRKSNNKLEATRIPTGIVLAFLLAGTVVFAGCGWPRGDQSSSYNAGSAVPTTRTIPQVPSIDTEFRWCPDATVRFDGLPTASTHRDRFGDPLPHGAVSRLGALRFQFGRGSLAYSADGDMLVSGSAWARVYLWEAATGSPIRSFDGRPTEDEIFYAVRLSPDGKRLAGGSERRVFVWEVATGRVLSTFDLPIDELVWSVDFSPDLSRVAVATHKSFHAWHLPTERAIRLQIPNGLSPANVTFSPDGGLLAGGAVNGVVIWKLPSGKQKRSLPGVGGKPVFSRDGLKLATSYPGVVEIWDVNSGEEKCQLTHRDEILWCGDFSRDGNLFVAGGAGTLTLWNVGAGEQLWKTQSHGEGVSAVSFTPDESQVVSTGEDEAIRFWNAETGDRVRRFESHDNGLIGFAFNGNGSLVATGGLDAAVRVWKPDTGEPVFTLEQAGEGTNHVQSVAFSHDGRVVVSSDLAGTIYVWDAVSGQKLSVCSGFAHTLGVASDGSRFFAGWSQIDVWDCKTGTKLAEVKPEGQQLVEATAFSADGRRGVITSKSRANERLITVYDLTSDPAPIQRVSVKAGVAAMTLSRDGTTLAVVHGGYDEIGRVVRAHNRWRCSIIDVDKGTTVTTFPWSRAPYERHMLALTSDGSLMAGIYKDGGTEIAAHSVRIYETRTGKLRAQIPDFCSAVAFSPDAKLLMTNSQRTALAWDVERLLAGTHKP